AASRTTIPVIAQWSHFIIGRGELLCPLHLLMLRLVNVILNHPKIELMCTLDDSEIATVPISAVVWPPSVDDPTYPASVALVVPPTFPMSPPPPRFSSFPFQAP